MVAAGKDMNLHVVTGGPMTVDPVSQVAEIESWIIEKVDCIMVSAADPDALTPIINKAVKAGIVVVTFDSDAPYSKRHVFDVQCSSRVVADYQIDTLAREMHSKGQWAYIGGELTQIEKQLQFSYMKARAKSLYPKMEFMAAEYCADNTQLAANQASELIVRFPNLGGLVSNSGSGCIGAAEGTEASHKAKIVKVTGTPLPSTAATYVRDGTMPECFFWNTRHQGYRAAALGYKLLTGKDIHDNTSLRLWTGMAPLVQLEVNPFNSKNLDAILGPPGIINTHNINQWVPID
jgi:ABC-type sugar transport system substrate-binding protein